MGLLLDNNADTNVKSIDAEIALVQAMIDKGCEKDSKPAEVFESGEESDYGGYNENVKKDDNYKKAVELITTV